MARSFYPGDLMVNAGAGTPPAVLLGPGSYFTVWSLKTGGSQYTDLKAEDGVTTLPTSGSPAKPFADGNGNRPSLWGPDAVNGVLWCDTGVTRYPMYPSAEVDAMLANGVKKNVANTFTAQQSFTGTATAFTNTPTVSGNLVVHAGNLVSMLGAVVNTRVASYVAVATDAGKEIEMNVATANTLTINANVFSANQKMTWTQLGIGLTTFVAGAGMTLLSEGGLLTSAGQYSIGSIRFRSATEAVVSGHLAAGSGGPVGITLPARLWGLWINTFNPPKIRDIPADVRSTATHLILAMSQSAGSGTGNLTGPSWSSGTQAEFIADIAAFKATGKHVLIGIGGSSDGGITIGNSTQVTQAVNSIAGIVSTYGVTGIDLDLEPSGSSWVEASLVSLCQQLKTNYGSGFVIGLTPGLYSPYDAQWMSFVNALGATNWDYMAPMLYDFPEAGDSRLNAVVTGKCSYMASNGIPQSKMVMGYMGRQNASYPNSSPPKIMLDAHNYGLANGYPSMRGAFVWEATQEQQQNHTATRLLGQSIVPASSTGILINEPFTTNSTGSTPLHLVLGQTPTGGGVTINGNQADFATGSAGITGAAAVSRRLSADSTTAISVADISITCSFTRQATVCYPEIIVRSNQTAPDGDTCYSLSLDTQNSVFQIFKDVAYTETSLASTAFTYTVGTQYQVRFRVVGSSLQASIGVTLPGSPTLSVADSGVSAAGFAALKVNPPATASVSHALFDNVLVTTGA